MKKYLVLVACFIMVVGFGISRANAAGFGFYGTVGSGSGDFTYEGSPAFDVDTTHSGVGFVFDSAVARDTLFNYQLNLGYDKFTLEDPTGDELELSGLMISNAFGFGVVRTEGFRMWLGPEIRLAWANGSKYDIDYDLFGLGFGPALGMNFNLPGPVTLAVKVGYQIINYSGEANSAFGWSDVDLKEKMAYVNLSLMFRSSGDTF
jgi:hypothetical protein